MTRLRYMMFEYVCKCVDILIVEMKKGQLSQMEYNEIMLRYGTLIRKMQNFRDSADKYRWN